MIRFSHEPEATDVRKWTNAKAEIVTVGAMMLAWAALIVVIKVTKDSSFLWLCGGDLGTPDPETFFWRTSCLVIGVLAVTNCGGWALFAFFRNRWPRPATFGRAEEQKVCGDWDATRFAAVLEGQEAALAVALVDEPNDIRPDYLPGTVYFFLLFALLLGAVGLSVFAQVGGYVLEEDLLILLAVACPLLAVGVAFCTPGDWLNTPLSLGVAVLGPVVASKIQPTLTGHLIREPLGLATTTVVVVGGAFLCWRLIRRPRRLLLITSEGLRLIEDSSGEMQSIRGPMRPRGLRLEPGFGGSAWVFDFPEEPALRVRPRAPNPTTCVAALEQAGISIEPTGKGGIFSFLGEAAAAWPLAVLTLLCVGFTWAVWHPLVRTGTHLGLRLVAHFDVTATNAEGGGKMIATADTILAVLPYDASSLVMKGALLHDLGDREGALEVYRKYVAVLDGARWPVHFREKTEDPSGVPKLFHRLGDSLARGCPGALPEGPAQGWEPEGSALLTFRNALRWAGGQETKLVGVGWPDWIEDLQEARRISPEAPGPILLAVWSGYHGHLSKQLVVDLLSVESPAQSEKESEPEPRTDEEAFVQDFGTAIRADLLRREAVLRLLKDLEQDPRWRGLSAWLSSAYAHSIREGLAEHILTAARDGRSLVFLRDHLDSLRRGHFLSPEPGGDLIYCDLEKDLAPIRRFLHQPPTNLEEFKAAMPMTDPKKDRELALLLDLLSRLTGGDLENPEAVIPKAFAEEKLESLARWDE